MHAWSADHAIVTGFVDDAKGASMLVTRARFQARYEAPPAQYEWTVDWDCRAAAALKAAMSPAGAGASWHEAPRLPTATPYSTAVQ